MSALHTVRRLAVTAAGLATGAGLFALIAWAFGNWQLLTLGPGYAPIGQTTALLLAVLGLGATALASNPQSSRCRSLARWSARVVVAVVLASVARTVMLPVPSVYTWSPTLPMPPAGQLVGLISLWTAAVTLMAAIALRTSSGEPDAPSWPRSVGIVAMAVGLVSSLVFVLGYVAGTPVLYGGDGLPMSFLGAIGFLLINAALVSTQVHRVIRDDDRLAGTSDRSLPGGPMPVGIALILTGVAILASLTAFFYLRDQQSNARAIARQNLEAIGVLKVTQIAQWRAERLNEIRLIFGAALGTNDLEQLIAQPDNSGLRRRVADWLVTIRDSNRYEAIDVYDRQGRPIVAAESTKSAHSLVPPPFATALTGGEIILDSRHHSKASGKSHIDSIEIIAALKPRGAQRPGTGAAGFVVVTLNPHTELFPLVARWPLPSQSAEAYVIEPNGGVLTILSETRFGQPGSAPFSAPVNDRRLSAAAAARGERGVIEGLDYRGVPVLSVALPIPSSPWILVAEIDQSEAYADVATEAWRTALLVSVVLSALLLSGAFAWRHRRAQYLQQSLNAEHESRSLAERLALVSQNANDVILLFDEAMRIVQANDRVLSAYGRTPAAMTAGLTALDLRPPTDGEAAKELFQKVFGGEATLFETVHQRVDGSLFPVEVSSRPVTIMGRPHVLSVIRDISERKAHEKEIERLSRLNAALAHVNQSVAQASSRETLLTDACRSLVEAGGFRASWIGWPDPATAALNVVAHWGDETGYVGNLQVTTTEMPRGRGPSGTAFRERRTVISNDFLKDAAALPWREAAQRARFAAAASLPILRGDEPIAILTVYAHEAGYFGPPEVGLLEQTARDVGFGLDRLDREAARSAAESERRVSDERLRVALTASKQGIYDVQLATGATVVTPEYALMLGYDPATFTETAADWMERLHPDDRERARRYFSDYTSIGEGEYRIEFRLRTASGGYKWILSLGRIVERGADGRPSRMLGIHADITERKQNEAEILAVQERLEATMNAIPDLLFELSREGRYLSFHSPRTDLLAAPAAAFMGRTIDEILPAEAAETTRLALAEADSEGRSNGRQFRLDLPQGPAWFELSIAKAPGASEDETRFVALSREITDRKNVEQEIRQSLHEKEALLKEVHHRVKNNLQVITSLLRLEASRSHETGTKSVLKDMQNRIRSMALLHETLYQTGNFAAVNLPDYLRRLASQLFRAHNSSRAEVRLALDLEPVSLSLDQAIPCGLIVNELLTNSLKHAFVGGKEGQVSLRLRVTAEPAMVELSVGDDGTGLPSDFAERQTKSLGMQLVSDLTRQLRGDLEIGRGSGASFTVRFPPDGNSRRTGPTARPTAIADAGGPVGAPSPLPAHEPPPRQG